jgi:hypothetical protein
MTAQGFEQNAGLILFFRQLGQPFRERMLCRGAVFGPSEMVASPFGMSTTSPGGGWLPILRLDVDPELLAQG